MTRIAIIIPTIGRASLANTIAALAPQVESGDRVMVVVDNPARYDFCSELVADARDASADDVAWRAYPAEGVGGCYGHAGRNSMLDLLEELEFAPTTAWSLDDDDVPTFGALDMIRSGVEEGGLWHIFRMRGGASSHFLGLVVPTMGRVLMKGNIGTPMLVWTVGDSRFGYGDFDEHGPGYFGDWEMAESLQAEFGDPVWHDSIVAEIRL